MKLFKSNYDNDPCMYIHKSMYVYPALALVCIPMYAHILSRFFCFQDNLPIGQLMKEKRKAEATLFGWYVRGGALAC